MRLGDRLERQPVEVQLHLPDGLSEGPTTDPHQEVNAAAAAAAALLAAAVRAIPAPWALVREPAVPIIATTGRAGLVGACELVLGQAAQR